MIDADISHTLHRYIAISCQCVDRNCVCAGLLVVAMVDVRYCQADEQDVS